MDKTPEYEHTPVLVGEVLAWLEPQGGNVMLDATLGLGGHARAYLDSCEQCSLVGLDADEDALEAARDRLAEYGDRVTLISGNFANLTDRMREAGFEAESFDYVLLDLGVGSHQLADSGRGFAFDAQEPLQMQYGSDNLPPAEIDVLNVLEQRLGHPPDAREIVSLAGRADLARIIRHYGEERYARRISEAIVQGRPDTAQALAETVRKAVPASYERTGRGKPRIDPATRTFQALRLAVNRELEALRAALPQAVQLLTPGGKLAVISFHSLEDRIVKRFMQREAKDCICSKNQPVCTCNHSAILAILNRKPIRPSEEELAKNPRARSAKLRIAEKIE